MAPFTVTVTVALNNAPLPVAVPEPVHGQQLHDQRFVLEVEQVPFPHGAQQQLPEPHVRTRLPDFLNASQDTVNPLGISQLNHSFIIYTRTRARGTRVAYLR